jgi:hypothetical protein
MQSGERVGADASTGIGFRMLFPRPERFVTPTEGRTVGPAGTELHKAAEELVGQQAAAAGQLEPPA